MNNLDNHINAYKGNIQYDFDNEILLNWYPQRVIENSKPNETILELGIGHGYSSNLFSNYFSKHTVIDGSKAIINNYTEKYGHKSNSQIINSFFEDFQTDERFNIIVMGFVLEHVNNPVEILQYYQQFLLPKGSIYISVPNAESLNRRLGKKAGILDNILTLSENDQLLGHQRFYTLETIKNDIIKAGLEIIKIEGIFLKPFTTSQLQSLNLSKEIINALCEVGVSYPELSCGILVETKQKT